MTSDQVKERIEVSKAESARLGQRLRGLSAEDLNQPSACDRWAVGDVVAHLVFVVQFQKNMIARGLQGEDSAPEGARRPGAADVPTEVRIAQGAIRLREKLGEGLLDAFDEKYRESFELVDSLRSRMNTPSPAGTPGDPCRRIRLRGPGSQRACHPRLGCSIPTGPRLPHVAGVAARGAGNRKQDDGSHGCDRTCAVQV